MKRNLFTQIKNEWRENLWLTVELLIVTGVIWIVCGVFYGKVRYYFVPRGFDSENVYALDTGKISKWSKYAAENTTGEMEEYTNDFMELLRRLRENPNVVEVAYHENAAPYSSNFLGNYMTRLDIVDTVLYTGNMRAGSPEIVKVFGYESLTGKSTEQLMEMLRNGEALLADNDEYEKAGENVMDRIGTMMIFQNDSNKIYKIGDVIRTVRRNEYDGDRGTIVIPLLKPEGIYNSYLDVAVKVKKGTDNRFLEEIVNNPELNRYRNVFLNNPKSLADAREEMVRETETNLRLLEGMLAFLLITVFLGLLGSFWFRIQQRINEIGLRKAFGATRRDIFRRIFSEGMVLLLLASVVLSATIWPFSEYFVNKLECTRMEFFIYELIAIALVALGIVVSLWYPARKAMNIEPAIALKNE